MLSRAGLASNLILAGVCAAPRAHAGQPVFGSPLPAGDAAQIAARAAVRAPVVESAPRFSPDGEHIAFVATYDGPPALYVQGVEPGGGEPRKVADLRGRFRRPVFSPDGRYLYFTRDSEGDEAYAIHRVLLATGAFEEVLAKEELRREGPWFAEGGERLLFSARPVEASEQALFEADPGGGAVRQIFSDGSLRLADVRADGKEVLLLAVPAEDALWSLEPGRGPPRRLYPSADRTARVRVHDATYSTKGDRVYVATDDGGDGTHLLALDPRTGRELRRTVASASGGDVHALAARAGALAYVLDLGTHHEVRIADAATLAPRRAIGLPLGSEVPGASHPNNTHGLSLSPNGRLLAVQWSTPSSPARIVIVDTRTGARRDLSRSPRPTGPEIAVRVEKIRSFDGLEVPVLVYVPAGGSSEKRPVVMSIHGGFPFAATARYDPWISTLLAEGYAVVEPNVRGSGGFGRSYERADDGAKKLDAVRDFRAVGEWIAAQPWADPKRVGVYGPSAGGYYTLLLLAAQSELWACGLAAVPLVDPAWSFRMIDGDLRRFWETELVPITEPLVLAAISPSTYVQKIRTPLFVYGAANDVRTPIAPIDWLVRELRDRGTKVEYMRAEGVGHSRDPKVMSEMTVRMLRFLRESCTQPPPGIR